MADVTQRWAEELKDSVEVVRTMRDELKVQLHLASMDAKKKFEELERRLEHEQSHARQNLKELIDGFREVKDELTKGAKRKH